MHLLSRRELFAYSLMLANILSPFTKYFPVKDVNARYVLQVLIMLILLLMHQRYDLFFLLCKRKAQNSTFLIPHLKRLLAYTYNIDAAWKVIPFQSYLRFVLYYGSNTDKISKYMACVSP